jgi:hypothetical protein
MDINSYWQRLIALEANLSNQIRRHVGSGREQLIDTAAEMVRSLRKLQDTYREEMRLSR